MIHFYMKDHVFNHVHKEPISKLRVIYVSHAHFSVQHASVQALLDAGNAVKGTKTAILVKGVNPIMKYV